jgi:hypothetical protein
MKKTNAGNLKMDIFLNMESLTNASNNLKMGNLGNMESQSQK